MIESFVDRAKSIFGLESLAHEDPQLLKGIIDELEQELEAQHMEYATVMSELEDRRSKISKALDGEPEDRAALVKSEEKVSDRIKRFEREHFEKVKEISQKMSKVQVRLDVIQKAHEDVDPFDRFNYDGINEFKGKKPTAQNVTDFIKSLHPDYIRRLYGEDPLEGVHVVHEDEYNNLAVTLAKAKEMGKFNGTIEKAARRMSHLVPIRKRAQRKDGTSYMTTVYVNPDDAKKLTKKQKAKLVDRSNAKKSQAESEKYMRIGDQVKARWVGSSTDTIYESPDLTVKEIKPDSVVLEFQKIFWTRNPEANYYAYRAGQTIEIPRTQMKGWDKNNSFDLMNVDIEKRKKEARLGISRQKIEELNAKGYNVNMPSEQGMREFNHKFKGFRFERLFGAIERAYSEVFGEDLAKASANSSTYSASIRGDGTFGFSASVSGRVRMSRDVRFSRGKKTVYHSLFAIDRLSDRGSGLGKKALRYLYREYKEAGFDSLGVGTAWVGNYTWGRLGFNTRRTEAYSQVGKFRDRVGKNIMIKPNYVGLSDDREWKREDGDVFIKEGDEWVNVTDEKVTIEEGSRSNDMSNISSGEQNRYKYDPTQEALLDYGNSEFYRVKEEDAEAARRAVDTFYENNSNDAPFPMRILCDIGNKKAGKAALIYGSGWSGKIDLNDDEQRKNFERAIGYKEDE